MWSRGLAQNRPVTSPDLTADDWSGARGGRRRLDRCRVSNAGPYASYRRTAEHDATSTRRARCGTPQSVTEHTLRVPAITTLFWIVKGLSTAPGRVCLRLRRPHAHPVPAVLLGFVGFLATLALQLSMRRYYAWTYWLAVVMVGIFGTMAADVLHVGLGVPYVRVGPVVFRCARRRVLVLAAVRGHAFDPQHRHGTT